MQNLARSFRFAWNGIRTTWREEFNFRIEIGLGMLAVLGASLLDFSSIEWILLIGCVGAVLSAELVNTAIEDLCNKVEPHNDPTIGKIKDIVAGFVFVVCVAVALIGVMLFGGHL